MDFTHYSERQISMQIIRWFAQIAEALSLKITSGMTGQDIGIAAEIVRRCADRAEHIAQYDIEDLPLKTRMQYLHNDLGFLTELLDRQKEILAKSLSHIPQRDDVLGLANRVFVIKE